MPKRLVLMTIHGMGDTDHNYYGELESRLRRRLGAETWSEVYFANIFYSDVFQHAQESYFDSVRAKVHSRWLRKFLLYGFADAGGLEHSRNIPDSSYTQVQARIFDELGTAYGAVGDAPAPLVLIAQSLGCHVVSNYIWDAQRHDPANDRLPPGIWSRPHDELSPEELSYRKFGSLNAFITTGCNIPIFVAGLPREHIEPIDPPANPFVWENYYDEDDALGWPLSELSDDYGALVQDHEVNVGGIFTSWNPFSHTKYWGDGNVIEPLAAHIERLL